MPERLEDKKVRLAAFNWLAEQVKLRGDVLPRGLLARGFDLEGRRVPLVSAQGIFKPGVLEEIPLSITTTSSGPYDDHIGPEGHINYRYRGTDPQHHENVGLRTAMARSTPLVYFHGLVPGKYLAIWPVYIVGDHPDKLIFKVLVDDCKYLEIYEKAETGAAIAGEFASPERRAYITSVVKQRLHQRGFRERVLDAYKQQCALCRLRHSELLEAAHIIPDNEPGGDPVVTNGIALCKLHHAAFDNFFLGIRPDFVVEIRRDVLEEHDGPMLTHGLQGLHQSGLILPRIPERRPDPERLEIRYEKFRALSG